ncbi:D-2-hydroxyacid dehydrogenase [uncultured Metabacillus sp.]|uniref:D-2-hydroxyacid dehydrogenase n=1 Tax=uncultured Metabacillus sp. TaxID=2860135 RepID=UPI002614D210|nr:D-2-hydroxyacid dehydrogenase [uncultured Metabacillus sp.]
MIVLSTVKLPNQLKEQLESSFKNVTFYHDQKINEAKDILPKAEIILTYGEDLTDEHIEAATNLKWIMVASAGIEKLPFEQLEKHNIHVTNARGVHAIPMAEYCIAMMLQVSRQASTLMENQKQHKWDRRVQMEELYGKTVYILGAGAIGTAIAKLSNAFGMQVLGMNRDGRAVEYFHNTYSFKEMLVPMGKADFIISVLPSTEQTKGLLTYEAFKRMKEDAVFINIGRGDAVIEGDLIHALNEKQIKHAVLDVFEKEPLNEDHPFWDMENVTVTPHLSGITKNYLPRAMKIFEKNLKAYIEGQVSSMENIISLEKGY